MTPARCQTVSAARGVRCKLRSLGSRCRARAFPWLRSRLDEEIEQRLLEQGTYDESLPPPKQLVFADFRQDQAVAARTEREANLEAVEDRPLHFVQWNIERGYEIEDVKRQLAEIDADVLILQEIDVGCDRSGNRDVGKEIAEELSLNYVFLSEFIEHRSKHRVPISQGGGVHGNAILTKLDIVDAECIDHTHHPVTWGLDQRHTFAKREPRTGERCTLTATLEAPSGQQFQVYSVHLEVFCGPFGRMRQFADVLEHSRQKAREGVEQQVIGGDLNTMGHGIARISPYHCNDSLRWRTLGKYESEFWQEHLFDIADSPDGEKSFNQKLFDAGLKDEAVCSALTNPGFQEVFPVTQATLDNPSYRLFGIHLMEGKLDWFLHRGGMEVISSVMGNHDFTGSDHKWLSVKLQLAKVGKDSTADLNSHPTIEEASSSAPSTSQASTTDASSMSSCSSSTSCAVPEMKRNSGSSETLSTYTYRSRLLGLATNRSPHPQAAT